MNINKEVAAMKRMTVSELQAKYAKVFGEPTNGRHKQWLQRRIAWRMQANEHGGLSTRALKRARELANTADLRMNPPPDDSPATRTKSTKHVIRTMDERVPPVGCTIPRIYKNVEHEVVVLADGFEYDGEYYKSLSAIAKKISGQHCSGYRFFGLDGNGGGR